jgi:hypothetical protein
MSVEEATPMITRRLLILVRRHRSLIAVATAAGSWTSPSTTAPPGRPACPIRSSTTWPRRTDTSAARTAVVPMSSPTTFRATLQSPLLCFRVGR